MSSSLSYRNPIIRGFNPDPSVIRVGEHYYLATSSFHYFPAIPLYESQDLIHWRALGHVVTRDDQLDLRGLADSHGIWAPDLSYNDGVFYCIATLRLNGSASESTIRMIRRQTLFRALKPEGPWEGPQFIDIDGIDPSLFFDEDNRPYLCLEPGLRLIPLSAHSFTPIGPPETLWPGTGARCPEAPRLFKRGPWYYALLAEGGTGYGHRISAARAPYLRGPYEPSPYNPVLIQNDPASPIQRVGHGQFVEDLEGRWWCVYLCGRQNQGRYSTLGRETALDELSWTEDGWFLINGGGGPSLEAKSPSLQPQFMKSVDAKGAIAGSDPNGTHFDRFDAQTLSPAWCWLRNPRPNSWFLSLGGLVLLAGNHSLDSIHIDNVLLRRETEFVYDAESLVSFEPDQDRAEAGLVCYLGVYDWIACGVSVKDGAPIIRLSVSRSGMIQVLREIEAPDEARELGESWFRLRLSVRAQKRSFCVNVSNDASSAPFRQVGALDDCRFLSDEAVSIGKAHTGTMLGLYAVNGGTGCRLSALFREFRYTPYPEAATSDQSIPYALDVQEKSHDSGMTFQN